MRPMKTFHAVSWIVLLACGALAAHPSSGTQRGTLPKEVQDWIERSHLCMKHLGKMPEMETYHCSDLETVEQRLRIKYRSNRRAIRAMDQVTNEYNDVE